MTTHSEFIAIIFTDVPSSPANSGPRIKFGDFADQFAKLLSENPYRGRYTNYKKYRAKEFGELPNEEELKHCRGLLLTGSRDDSFNNNAEWLQRLEKLINAILFDENSQFYRKIPVCGICFGHQLIGKLINRYYNSRNGYQIGEADEQVNRNNKGWELGATRINVSEDFLKYAAEFLEDTVIAPVNNQKGFDIGDFKNLYLSESHGDIVYSIPEADEKCLPLKDLGVVGSTEICSIQGVFNRFNILTFQGHPEFSTDFMQQVLLIRMVLNKIISPEKYFDIINNETCNNGQRIGRVINGFFETFCS